MTKCLYDKRNKRNFNQVPWDTMLIHDSIYQHKIINWADIRFGQPFLSIKWFLRKMQKLGAEYIDSSKKVTLKSHLCISINCSCVRRYEVQEVWFKSVFYYIWWQLYKWIMTKFGISITMKCQGWFCHIVNFVNPNNSD